MNTTTANTNPTIAPLLRAMAKPKIMAATAMPQVISQANPSGSDLRFLYLSINKV
ncbi:unnamed protein product, partial [marine sediment metagenome]